MKKFSIKILMAFILFGAMLGMEGCSSKSEESNDGSSINNKEDLEKDAVNKETKEIDGKKVEEYTMKDGSKIQLEK